MAVKKLKTGAAALPKTPEVEEAPEGVSEEAVGRDPESVCCLDGVYVNHPMEARPRVISHNGQNFEHTHEDEHGVWCYRSM